MSLTLEDIIRVSREQAKEQADLYARQRAEERSEDLGRLSTMIENTVKTKIDQALNPVIDHQNKFEEKTNKAISDMSVQIAAIKALVEPPGKPQQTIPSQSAPHTYARMTQPQQKGTTSTEPIRSLHSSETDILIKQRFEAGRLTIGFEPIHKADLDRLARTNDIHDKDYVMKLAIGEFLRLEMNIKTVDSTNIVKVFTQHGKTDQECVRLYAQFDDSSIINLIFNHVSRLQTKEHRVVLYVPYTHQDQQTHLNNIAYPYRYPPPGQEKSKTRLKYGGNNLYLQFKPLSCNYWTTVHVPDLPPSKLRSDPGISASPPVGRQRDSNTNKRAASSSPQQKTPKVSRTSSKPDNDTSEAEADDNDTAAKIDNAKEDTPQYLVSTQNYRLPSLLLFMFAKQASPLTETNN